MQRRMIKVIQCTELFVLKTAGKLQRIKREDNWSDYIGWQLDAIDYVLNINGNEVVFYSDLERKEFIKSLTLLDTTNMPHPNYQKKDAFILQANVDFDRNYEEQREFSQGLVPVFQNGKLKWEKGRNHFKIETFILTSLEDLKKLPPHIEFLSITKKKVLEYHGNFVCFDGEDEREQFLSKQSVDSTLKLERDNKF